MPTTESLTVIWKVATFHQLQRPPALKQDIKTRYKKNTMKKIALPIIFHMPPLWPMYLFWVVCYFSFCAGQCSPDCRQRMSRNQNWFLLILQTAKHTKKVIVTDSTLLYTIFFLLLLYDDGCLTEGHTEAAIYVKWRLQKFNITISITVTWLSFFKIEIFSKVVSLTESGGWIFTASALRPIQSTIRDVRLCVCRCPPPVTP